MEWSHAATASASIHQANHREFEAKSHFFAVTHLAAYSGVRSASAEGEIIAGHDDAPAIDSPGAENKIGGRKGRKFALAAVAGSAGEGADLVE